ncbi:MAG: NUDIX hydrolase [Vampirovibrionia bacterium]
MGAGILPVAIHDNQVYLLLGKDVGTGSWSDFGGGRENNETHLETAIREGVEELNGFFGTESDMRTMIKNNCLGVLETKEPVYKCFLIKTDYDFSLPKYFNSNFKLMNRKLKTEVERHNGLFEKSEIRWVSLKEIKKLTYRRYFYYSVYPLIQNFFSNYKV